VTLVDWDDLPKWKLICDTLNLPFHEPAETYSTSKHLYFELDIPESAKGVLPRSERTRAGLDAERVEDLGGPKKRSSRGADTPAAPRTGRGTRTRTSAPAAATEQSASGSSTPTERTGSASRNRRRRRTRSGAAVSSDSNTGSATES
jgi:hypothetical protein